MSKCWICRGGGSVLAEGKEKQSGWLVMEGHTLEQLIRRQVTQQMSVHNFWQNISHNKSSCFTLPVPRNLAVHSKLKDLRFSHWNDINSRPSEILHINQKFVFGVFFAFSPPLFFMQLLYKVSYFTWRFSPLTAPSRTAQLAA